MDGARDARSRRPDLHAFGGHRLQGGLARVPRAPHAGAHAREPLLRAFEAGLGDAAPLLGRLPVCRRCGPARPRRVRDRRHDAGRGRAAPRGVARVDHGPSVRHAGDAGPRRRQRVRQVDLQHPRDDDRHRARHQPRDARAGLGPRLRARRARWRERAAAVLRAREAAERARRPRIRHAAGGARPVVGGVRGDLPETRVHGDRHAPVERLPRHAPAVRDQRAVREIVRPDGRELPRGRRPRGAHRREREGARHHARPAARGRRARIDRRLRRAARCVGACGRDLRDGRGRRHLPCPRA